MDKIIDNRVMFSIIIPVYNVEQYLVDCVNSVLQQSCGDYEIILVDDGSTDRSGFLCDELGNTNAAVRVIHKKNGGLSSARNEGVKQSTGRYVYFLDSDDSLSDGALESFKKEIITNKYPDIVLENGQYTLRNDRLTVEKKYQGGAYFGVKNGRDTLGELLKGKNLYAAFGKCFRRSFWIRNDFKFDEKTTSEDLELIYKVIYDADTVVMTSEPYYIYRMGREQSIMNRFGKDNLRDLFYIFKGWESFFIEENCDARIVRGMRNVLGNVYYNMLFVLDKENDEKLYAEAAEFLYLLQNAGMKEKIEFFLCKFLGIRAGVRVRYLIRDSLRLIIPKKQKGQ